MQFSFRERDEALRGMVDQGVDILVIGGGITGAGVALDAATRGFRVGLVEKHDFASGTSSKSTKLVHGGIRYLPQFDFALVREALIERGLLVKNAPYLVQPIGFVLPLYWENKHPLGVPISLPRGIGMRYFIRAGLVLYDLMAGKLKVRAHRRLGVRRAIQLAPGLRKEGMRDAFIYYDAQTDDTMLTTTVLQTAASKGALIANYAEVTGFDKLGEQITAVHVRDNLSGQTHLIQVKTAINAAGVFAGRIEAMAGQDSKVHITPAKGTHLTVTREALQIEDDAVVLPETDDGRILFIVPWGSRVTVGTTDTPADMDDLDNPVATEADVEYLLRHVNRYMNCQLTVKDVISAWAGYRPLISQKGSDKVSSKLSRTHVVLKSPGGMFTIVGGKLTTYRRMAQDVMNEVCRHMQKNAYTTTEDLPLVGSKDWERAAETVRAVAPQYALLVDTVCHLKNYGDEAFKIINLLEKDASLSERIVADLPYIMAEVIYVVRYRMAMQLSDVLERRLHVNFEDWKHGSDAAPDVAAVMAQELGWNAGEVEQQVKSYRERIRS